MESTADTESSAAMQVLISGYSGRAAAWSVVRAGFEPIVIDECQDLDLPAGSSPPPAATLGAFSEDIPFLPTGGWENRLDELSQLATIRPLWSPSPAAMQQARDPLPLQQRLGRAGFDALAIRTRDALWVPPGKELPREWIRKDQRSTGGMAVHRVHSCAPLVPGTNEFDQQYVEGPLLSAQFFSTGSVHKLLGITRILVGSPELPARPFAYVGNVSCSREESAAVEQRIQSIGDLLGKAFSLVGPWGIDFCRNASGLYVLELNPRYTAAMEVLELATGKSILQTCSDFQKKNVVRPLEGIVGKATVYAPLPFQLLPDWDWSDVGVVPYDCWEVPSCSDLARPGTQFSAGDPVCTVWQTADSVEQCLIALANRRSELLRALLQ
ncbi:ATP-grasp domain-containing protein [Rubinisphaera margarita]|uniref:ATP-grasp domain-containing protein n=1 Tax=Rubinisphaera margarita TaxID=2909586 RepID=UPI001EE841E8|nr:ATP-grasp domain-containing protein [Rubinisphaera margarita]MCG6157409.1 ATP-grasp domain-containing protein [Rubinisphaera margarita]